MSQQLHTTLTGWQSIAAVSAALGVPKHTIHGVVARAADRRQAWVQQEPDGLRCWLMNTDSLAYQRHAKRWQRLAAQRKSQGTRRTALSDLPDLPFDADLQLDEEDLAPFALSGPLSATWSPAPEVARDWPELCRWLREQGVLIFTNALCTGETTLWQWRWGELEGAGCESSKAAIVAALKAKLAACGTTGGLSGVLRKLK